jgi:uncharacterized protein YbcC (UPF0753/DUF2309 family)
MIVKNTKKRVLRINGVVLFPGANTLNKKQHSLLLAESEHVEDLIENEVLNIPEFESTTNNIVSSDSEEIIDETFDKLNLKETIKVVKETFNKEALEQYNEAELKRDKPRQKVLEEIESQIDKIVEAGKKQKEKE